MTNPDPDLDLDNLYLDLYAKLELNWPLHFYDQKFLLIQVPKTASTYLVKRYPELVCEDYPQIYRHEGIGSWVKALGPEKINSLESIGLTRNPYDRLISYYFHRIRHSEIPKEQSFYGFLRDVLAEENPHLHQHQHLCNRQGKILVKHLLKFEDGMKHNLRYLNDIGLPSKRYSRKKINKNPVRPKKNLISYFRDDCVQLIQKEFHLDFEIFDYPLRPEECVALR